MHIGFGEKARRKVTLRRRRCRWEDTIKMDLRETGYGGMDWIGTSGGLNEPSGSIKCWEMLE
jgi:hypothetical protein